MKEKIWMEKLVDLLNEYVKELWIWDYVWWHNKKTVENSDYIITKKFWFIKWLVENDKIDREKFWNSETKSSKYSDFELSYDTPREDYTNILLMELSISDTPIEDLLLYLK